MSNQLFWRVIGLAAEVGAARAASPAEAGWAAGLAGLEAAWPSPSLDIGVADLLSGPDEARFWAAVSFEVAALVYARRLGGQDDQTWQPATIWAAHGLGVFLDRAARAPSWPPPA